MSVQQLDHLNLSITDWDESVSWYGRVFGFEIVEEGVRRGARWGVLRSGDALLCLYEAADRHVASDEEAQTHRLHQLNHFGLRITDREAWEQTVAAEGLEYSYPSPVRWPYSQAWYVLDPSGHEIEVALWNDDTVRFAS